MHYLLSILLLLCSFSFATTVSITTASLPGLAVEQAYSASIYASGGCTPYRWWVSSGSLPPGLKATASSSTTSFLISGTPTTAGTYTFSASVKGCGGHVSTKSYSVVSNSATSQHVVNLSWIASTSSNVMGYNVLRSTTSGGPYQQINTGGLVASTLFTDSSMVSGNTYYYVAVAVDNLGNTSTGSNQTTAVVPYP
jgi:hypothetical protein